MNTQQLKRVYSFNNTADSGTNAAARDYMAINIRVVFVDKTIGGRTIEAP